MNHKSTLRLLSFFIFFAQNVFAQGVLQGVVGDSTSNQELIGANVYLKGTAMGAISDIEGKYRIGGIPEGTYSVRFSYLGFTTKIVDVKILDNQTVVINANLVPDVIEGNEVVITAQARGQLSAMNQQLKSTTMMNVVSEEKIKELPDANAAEAIGRLPGVSLIRSGGEANKVILRGMNDKYARVTIDGVGMASTDSNARGIDLSMISQGTLSGVELYKSLTPDRDADAIAGSINLVTKRAPYERDIRVDLKGDYNQLKPTYKQYDFSFYYGERFFEDIFGFQMTGNLEQRDRSSERINVNAGPQNSDNLSEGWWMTDVILDYNDETRKRNGISLFFDVNTPDSGSIRFNNVYSATNRNSLNHLRDYPNGASNLVSNGNGVSYIYRYTEQEISTYNSSLRGENHIFDFDIVWGGSFSQSVADIPFDHELQFTEPSGLNVSGMRAAPPEIWQGPPELFIPLAYNNFQAAYLAWGLFNTKKNLDKERTIYADISKKYVLGDVFSGDFKFGGKYKYKNRIKNSTQDFSPYYTQGYNFIRNADGSLSPKNYNGTYFQNIQKSDKLILMVNFLDKSPVNRNLFDKYAMYPLINADAIKDWYNLNQNGFDDVGAVPEYAKNVLETGNYYDVKERVAAGYAMNTFNIGQDIMIIAGVRVEQENNDYNARYSLGTVSGFPVPSGIFRDTLTTYTETNVLPHLHLTVKPLDFLTVRFAAYKALARPDFNTRLATSVADGSSTLVILGNPNLRSAKAWNYELNTSFYGNDIGLISISAFYKEIKDIANVTNRLIANNQQLTSGKTLLDSLGIEYNSPFSNSTVLRLNVPYNPSTPTKVWGFEFEHQANLNFLPGYLQFLVLSYNFSFIKSETRVLTRDYYTTYDTTDSDFGPVITPVAHQFYFLAKNKLFGQPEFFGNFALGYDIHDFSIRLSLFYQAAFARQYAEDGRNESMTDEFSRWDLSMKQKLNDNISLLFTINNLNNYEEGTSVNYVVPPFWKLLDTRVRYGLSADLGVRVDL